MRRLILLALLASAALAPAAVVAAPKPPKPAPAVTATPSPVTITWGKASTIKGRLTNGTAAGGQTVTLQQTPFPFTAPFRTLGTAVTGADGSFAFVVTPGTATRYRVRFKKAESPVALVQVRVRVSFAVSDKTPKVGRRVKFAGRVTPEHDGRKAYVQRRSSTGKWKTVKTTPLRNATGKPYSSYAVRIRVKRTGTLRVRVPTGDFDHLKG